ncbi:hypothetical protein GCM10025784_31950 [Citricoccus nitrophenolicus]
MLASTMQFPNNNPHHTLHTTNTPTPPKKREEHVNTMLQHGRNQDRPNNSQPGTTTPSPTTR